MGWLLHWLNVHLWGPMWPNMFAPSMITLAAVAVSHVKQHRASRARHEELKRHVTEAARDNAGGGERGG